MISASTNSGAELGAIPENVSENMRPNTAAGLANDVEEVKKYAAPIQAATKRAIFLSYFCLRAK